MSELYILRIALSSLKIRNNKRYDDMRTSVGERSLLKFSPPILTISTLSHHFEAYVMAGIKLTDDHF